MWRVGEYARTEARPPPPSQQQSDGGGGGGNRSAKKGRPQVGVGTEGGRCRPFLFPALFFLALCLSSKGGEGENKIGPGGRFALFLSHKQKGE